MVGRVVVAVAVVLCMAVPAGAAPGTPTPLAGERFRVDERRGALTLADAFERGDRDAVLRAAAASTLDGLRDGAAADSEESRRFYDDWVFSGTLAGDLNGDGVRDLLVERRDQTQGCCQTFLVAVSGGDGSTLWERELADWFFSGWAPAKVGDGGHGIVLLDYSYPNGDLVEEVSVTVTALDGAGTQLWSSKVSGRLLENYLTFADVVADDVPIRVALGDVSGDGVHDLRVFLLDRTLEGTAAQETSVGSLVVDGVDGTIGARGSDVKIEGLPAVERMVDVTGDGVRELAVLDLAKEATTVHGVDPVTGAAVWRGDDVDLYSMYVYDEYLVWLFAETFTSVGDVTGDGRPEVAITQFDRESRVVFDTVLDAASGAHGFSTEAEAYELGDIDGDGRAEAGVGGLWLDDDGSYFARYDALDFGGALKRRNDFRVPAGDLLVASQQFPDIDGDGVTDASHRLVSSAGADRGVFDGRSMTKVWEPPERGYFTSSIDGDGDDFVVTAGKESPTVTTVDGATGSTLWQRTLGLPAGTTGIYPGPVDVNGDHRSEMLVSYTCTGKDCSYDTGSPATLLDATDGSTLWHRSE